MKPSLKIAVYTIALNEEKHVKRWFDSARDADLLLIADTGSTDKTRFVAKSLGIAVHEVEVKPWRFDVARNASLALIPEDFDICIQLDMDEVLPKGWRSVVEEAFLLGNNWPLYKHVTSRFEDGTARAFQMYFKIHPRRGFFWKYPIHEVLTHSPEVIVVRKEINLEVDHLQDKKKSRHSYLNLLELAVNEEPKDWRMNHYLNREYFYNRDWVKVLQSAYVCEKISGGWEVERASTYMWASEAALNLKFPGLAEHWAEQATLAAPEFYEAWHWRAHIAHLHEKWFDCLHFASKILTRNRQKHHLVKPSVWEWWGYDLIALAHYKLGNFAEAITYGRKALSGATDNTRLQKNLEFYEHDFGVSQVRGNLNEIKGNTEYPDWFSLGAKSNFERFLPPFAGHENFKCLQLGVFTGDASLWMLENVLTNKDSSLTDVDTWEGSQEAAYTKIDVEGSYNKYLEKISHHRERIKIFRCSTLDFLCARHSLPVDHSQFDFIYIDADHTAVGVLVDAVLSWPLLKSGGIMAFDDYTWHHETRNPVLEPKKGIDLFLEHCRDDYELLVINWQVWIQKK